MGSGNHSHHQPGVISPGIVEDHRDVPACTPDELREIGLFGALPDDALAFLCTTLKVATVPAGELIFREGEPGRDLYVVLDGELEVMKASRSGVDARVALLGVRDWFGEMSLLDVQPRSATVRAVAPSRLLHVTSSDLDALYRRDLKSYALVVLNVARELSRRLRVADAILAQLVMQMADAYQARPLAATLDVTTAACAWGCAAGAWAAARRARGAGPRWGCADRRAAASP